MLFRKGRRLVMENTLSIVNTSIVQSRRIHCVLKCLEGNQEVCT